MTTAERGSYSCRVFNLFHEVWSQEVDVEIGEGRGATSTSPVPHPMSLSWLFSPPQRPPMASLLPHILGGFSTVLSGRYKMGFPPAP